MDFETLLCSLPETYANQEGDLVGLNIQYKPSISQWLVGYGHNHGTITERKLTYRGVGFSPYEALQDFIEKMRKNKK